MTKTPYEPRIYRLLMKLRTGGVIVSSKDCSPDEIAIATANDRFVVDSDGFGYLWRPPSR
jgi:hypothetical protein